MLHQLASDDRGAERESATRQALLERTCAELAKIAGRKGKTKSETIGELVGKLLAKTKMGKFIEWQVEDGRLVWNLNQARVSAEKALDGCYVIKTTVSAGAMDKEQVVGQYKGLAVVEQAFRNMKSVSLEMRPVHHKKDERIKAHVFLCMLAYYLQWHFRQRLEPLFAGQEAAMKNGKLAPKHRAWTLEIALETLKSLRRNEVSVAGVSFKQLSEATQDQKHLLDLLGVELSEMM